MGAGHPSVCFPLDACDPAGLGDSNCTAFWRSRVCLVLGEKGWSKECYWVVLANLRSWVLLSPVSSQESQKVNLCVIHMYIGDTVTVIPSFMLAFYWGVSPRWWSFTSVSVCIKVNHPDMLVYRDRLIGLSRGVESVTCVIDVLHEFSYPWARPGFRWFAVGGSHPPPCFIAQTEHRTFARAHNGEACGRIYFVVMLWTREV